MKYNYLLIGDPHMTPTSLDEGTRLFAFSVAKANELQISTIIIMGDLFDTHSVLHTSVLNFYFDIFKKYSHIKWITLVGNHDHPLHRRTEHALVGFKSLPNVTVVDDLMHFEDFDAMPYTSNDEFLELCQKRKSSKLLCHHEFDGASYENGFFSSHGIDLMDERIQYTTIVSGHIHKIQSFSLVKYLGAPRWITKGDANQERGIWAWDGKGDFEFFSTEEVVGKIISVNVNENGYLAVPDNLNLYKKVILQVKGTAKFIKEMTEKYSGAEIVPVIEDEQQSKVSEAMGVNEALKKFIMNDYKIQFSNLTNEVLLVVIADRLNNV